jgi:DNA helicase-2/ATP-dependent DNA helicase PcrA
MARRFKLDSATERAPEESDLLTSLNPEQREAASHVNGPLLILAGAGSGKTRVMTHRIAYLVRDCGVFPEQILAMTFTNKAAGEMRERVDALMGDEFADEASRITISTFHSLGARLIRRHSRKLGLTPGFVIYDQDDQTALVKRVMEEEDLGKDRSEARRLRGFIESMKNRGLTPAQAHEHAFDRNAEDDVFFYERYQHELRAANCVDFGDLILGMLEIFRGDPELARGYSMQWRYVMVDEFQDTNPSQYELLRHFTSYHDNLAVVGDDDQAIYRWRGATVANILGFEDDFPDAKVVKLEQNYRSTQRILDAANDVIQHNSRRRDKRLWTEEGDGPAITVFTANDDREEAQWVSRRISELGREGKEWGDIAVFYRTNAQGRAFEEQLRFHGIPYQLIGGLSFYSRAEIKDVLAYLKVALNPENEVDLARVINTPSRGIGKGTFEKLRVAAALPHVGSLWNAVRYAAGDREDTGSGDFLPGLGPPNGMQDPELADLENLTGRPAGGVVEFTDLIQAVRDDLVHHTSLAEVVRTLIDRIDYMGHLESSDPERAEDKTQNVAELVNAIEEFEKDFDVYALPEANEVVDDDIADAHAVRKLRVFLDRSALLASTDLVDDYRGAVTLMTVHGSKGLEFDTVFLVGMEDELFPSMREHTPEEEEEERRLAYVAITRAEHKLHITNAKRRRVYGQFKNTRPSRFLLDIDPGRLEVSADSASHEIDYAARFSGATVPWKRGKGSDFNFFGGGVDRAEWEFDQSPDMVRDSVAKGRKKLESTPQWDEFSQINEWELEEAAAAEEVEWTPPSEPRGDGDLIGATVSHSRFGVGEVRGCSGEGDKAILEIYFPREGVKKIIRKFVKVLA